MLPTSCEGVYLPCSFATAQDIASLARMAESLGFYSLWGNEFLVPTPSMEITDTRAPNFYELLTTLAYIAAQTETVRLGTCTMSVPQRDPLILAKQVATLDVLSNGRFMLGVGLGAYRDEFEAVKPRERSANRGKMLQDIMEALSILITQDDVHFESQFVEFRGVSLNPKPLQKPFPLYIAGTTSDTLRRIAKWGTGWFLSRTQKEPISERISKLLPWLRKYGRNMSEIDLVATRGVSIARTYEQALIRFKESALLSRMGGPGIPGIMAQNLIGTPEDVAEQIEQLRREGVTHCIAQHFAVNSFSEMSEQTQMFAEQVMPLVTEV